LGLDPCPKSGFVSDNNHPKEHQMVERIFSGGEFEAKIGYCRAVVAGGFIHVAGTVGQGDTVTDQCRAALETIKGALEQAGATLADVVRVNYYLPDRSEFEPCWPILAETFGANPPAATMIECGLIDPKFRIEIEVTAYIG
jgi:enamine deaminase RidA (YjgF/YER057c/UK114 family)